MIIEDAVILSIAKPIKLSDGRISKCVIAYSEELKELIRIYPTYHKSKKIIVGNKVRISVIRGDSRAYSFKLKKSKNLKKADRHIKIIETLDTSKLKTLIKSLPTTTISKLNESKKSMGIVIPKECKILYDSEQPEKIFLKYEDDNKHRQQILDNNFTSEKYSSNDLALIVGNHHAYRNAFMVISAIDMKEE